MGIRVAWYAPHSLPLNTPVYLAVVVEAGSQGHLVPQLCLLRVCTCRVFLHALWGHVDGFET